MKAREGKALHLEMCLTLFIINVLEWPGAEGKRHSAAKRRSHDDVRDGNFRYRRRRGGQRHEVQPQQRCQQREREHRRGRRSHSVLHAKHSRRYR